jgi:hypothetical protein
MHFSLRFALKMQKIDPQSRAGSFGCWLGTDDFLRGGRGCILGIPAWKRIGPESPRDASWGERYFHMLDSDGHELSFARPI